MFWGEFEQAAAEIAGRGRDRIDQTRVALLGTLRADGSPRISPVEPFLSRGHLLVGVMARSAKQRDLLGDPRCVLHSAVSAPDSGAGELKLYGRMVEAEEQIRSGCREGWWCGRPAEEASVYSLDIEQAVFVSWELERGEMTVRRWSAQAGCRESTRHYP